MPTSLKVLSYNIHKGYSSFNRKYVLQTIRESIRSTSADLLCLQEIGSGRGSISSSQLEYLADNLWPHFSYGKNAVQSGGDHGNAILSKFPIVSSENTDISTNKWEQRGLLHASVQIPNMPFPIEVFCTHLNLFERSRRTQTTKICGVVEENVSSSLPVILAGDFNDWNEKLSSQLLNRLQLEEVHLSSHGTHPATFPSWLPRMRLDRIYQRHFHVKRVHYYNAPVWRNLSDHLPVMVELEWK